MHIAIVGCGQLSRMLALAGIPMGIKFSFLNDNKDQDTRCVDGLGHVVGLDAVWQSVDDTATLYQALGEPDHITIEKEHVNSDLLAALNLFCPIYPKVSAIKTCQHRHSQKRLLTSLSIATSPYLYGICARQAMQQLDLPLVVKSCREGYDGKNQWLLKTPEDVEQFDLMVAQDAQQNSALSEYIIEAWLPFEKEVSLISARSVGGEIIHYPLTENSNENGMLKRSIAPALHIPEQTVQLAQANMEKLLIELDYVGVLAMECFMVEGELIVNELAPRVHNSGHWTQVGSLTCQFENHLRAIGGSALGSTELLGIAGMVNLVGIEKPPLDVLSKSSKLYWYNKLIREQRKLGHINYLAKDFDSLSHQMA
ncbi:MAG: 5-(carboxyamino)imidazole ribonucleotide synthase [Phenylobacterium sp.]|jgi:5-(carboxyamino)imidazole ribonucleotide synthase